MMDFFAHDDDVAQLERALDTAATEDRLALKVELAWQLRQRDTARAVSLVEGVLAELSQPSLSPSASRLYMTRLQLVQGEAKWLFGEMAQARAFADSALSNANASDDALGAADAYWLLAFIAVDQGDMAAANAALEAIVQQAQGIDTARVTIAQAAIARSAVFRDVVAAKAHWGPHFSHPAGGERHPAAACWVEDFWGLSASLSSDYVESIRHVSKAYTLALATGQLRRAIIVAGNIGAAFSNLNDCDAALEWMQRSLNMAQQSRWPGMIGTALTQTAEILRMLQRFDAAADMLREALVSLAPMAASRTYSVALRYLADVELDRKNYDSALDTFRLVEQRAVALDLADQLTGALCGQARALLERGQTTEALAAAEAALEVAQSNANHQVAALRVLADIYARNDLAAPRGISAPNASLHYLRLALDLASTIESNTVPVDLLESAALQYANVGDDTQAFALAKQAIEARKKAHSLEARNRAHAIQVGHEMERARLDSLHQQQLAQAHAERADALEQANQAYISVLENAQDAIVLTDTVGHIKNWNRQAVLTFGWTLAEVSGRLISTAIFPDRLHRQVAAMVASRQMLRDDHPRTETVALRRDGSEFPIELSLTSVQVGTQLECSFFIRDISQRRKAELEIADALAKQLELVELKSRFIAMASHEFRTPLAVILSASDILRHYSDRLAAENRVAYFDEIGQAVKRMNDMLEDILVIGKSDAGVTHFNPQARDLRPLCASIVAEIQLSRGQHTRDHAVITVQTPPTPVMVDVDERWFRHIFGNLLSNAIKYSPDGGQVVLKMLTQDSGVELTVTDQGIGLPPQDLPRLFESFFRASNIGDIPGTGLGLSIVKRAVELHGGHITVTSNLGEGTCFRVILPWRSGNPVIASPGT